MKCVFYVKIYSVYFSSALRFIFSIFHEGLLQYQYKFQKKFFWWNHWYKDKIKVMICKIKSISHDTLNKVKIKVLGLIE
ncbi:hypothetical protein TRFO_34831 [Tritrichomonas foetus]|uniref:Uncharacterized protein n=1 Tax=Tritrichomonas foetus TaxID=1144522 RepID=A0A1J4JMC1_9EUKA|nr:hypothetical protein TRFO_34831 [Tritrichomonas foetus]|eukprot:OHS98685.1 hypothetical protein TRFO_34831 [Tritrichomonas foetus]